MRVDRRGTRKGASCARRGDRRTGDSGAAARIRARSARSTGRHPLSSRAARRSRSSSASRSGGAVQPSIGTREDYLESGMVRPLITLPHNTCVSQRSKVACCRPLGEPANGRLRTRTRPSSSEGLDVHGWAGGSGGFAAPALTSWHVAVHRLVLPAELPLVVSRELGVAPSLGADTIACILPVRSRKRADRSTPVPLLCHVVHILSDGTGGWEGVAAPLCTLFEQRTAPVHSEG